MKLGFIGTGTITAAMVTGLLSAEGLALDEIWVSPRGAETARRLALAHGKVRIGANNQEVVDRCEVVCLAVRPQVADEVLTALRFSSEHQVLSFIASYSRQHIQELVAPANRVVRAAPLPTVAEHLCTTVIFPADATAHALFCALGNALPVSDERAYDAVHSITAGMSSFFGVLQRQSEWLVAHDIAYADARRYLASLYFGLAHTMHTGETPFSTLSHEFTTPGGLNQQMFDDLGASGVFEAYDTALDRILTRVQSRPKPAG